MIPQRVQRQRTKGWRKPEGAVYVGRGTEWGNPFHVGRQTERLAHFGNLTREQAMELFALHIGPMGLFEYDQATLQRLHRLAGKDLMCWCPLTQPCHADVLLELANGERLPEGTPVLYWPGVRRGEGRRSVTRTPIWKMGSGTEVVSVEGYPGGIALTHIEPITESETE